MFWFIFILLLSAVLYLFFKKKKLFEKYKGLVEFLVVIFTVFITLDQLKSSAEDFNQLITRLEKIVITAEESKQSLNQVQKSLENLPTSLDSFSVSIDSLNKVVNRQRGNLDKSISSLSQSIISFQTSVKLLNDRFNRQPKIVIGYESDETDTTFILMSISLYNEGTLTADLHRLTIHLPNSGLIKLDLKNLRLSVPLNAISIYQRDFYPREPIIATFGRPLELKCNIEIDKRKSSRIYLAAYYTSIFGEDGFAELNVKY